jgi:hypothetical protein
MALERNCIRFLSGIIVLVILGPNDFGSGYGFGLAATELATGNHFFELFIRDEIGSIWGRRLGLGIGHGGKVRSL